LWTEAERRGTGLLERDRELAAVARALGGALAGAGRVLLVEGEAGAGKTALLASGATEARAAGLQVLSARAGVLERTVGLGIARELLETTVMRATEAERELLLAGAAALAAPLLGVAAAVPGLTDPAQARHGLYWLVANLAERRPLVIVLDDAQWCDAASLDWLLYLARRIERLPVAVLVAVRAGEPDMPRQILDGILAEPVSERVLLEPLGEAGTAALLAAAYGTRVDAEFAAACHTWTGGNPHFVSEVATELVAEGVAPDRAGARRLRQLSSERLATVTLMRIGRLPAPAAALAQALAILGFEAELRHAAALAQLTEEVAADAADALVHARIAAWDPLLRFVHPLVGAVVYDDVAPARRSVEHKRAARVLHDDEAAADMVAAHLLRVEPGRDPWVVARLRDAAGLQMEAGAATAVVALLRRALDEPPPRDALAGVHVALGLAEATAGDPGGLASLRRGLDASADADERAAIALLLGRFLLIAGRGRDAVEVLAEALAAGAADEEQRLLIEAALINAARSDVQLRGLADAHLRDVAGAAERDSPAGRLIAVQLAYAAVASGEPAARAAAFARTALGGDRLLAEAPHSPDAYLVPISMLALCDELEEAEAGYQRALAHAQAAGSSLAYAATATMYSWTAYLAGRLGDAELLARDALRIAAESPALAALAGFAGVHLATVLVERGAHDEGLALLGDDLIALETSPHTWARETLCAGGRALLAARRPGEALELLLACGRASEAFGLVNPAFLSWRSFAALALQELGDAAGAEALAADEVARARRFGAPRPLGIALRTLGLVTGDAEPLVESEAVLRASPALLERARTLVALGASLRRAGRRADAREPLAAGLELAERCGALPLIDHAREELAAAGARPRAHGRWDRDALTIAELRVCRLAAGGMSNPAIAQALFITRGTVESHLHVAYRKLGISSRTTLAAALERHEAGA
jgi:DNA-binding CsgD family transcriptional regulator